MRSVRSGRSGHAIVELTLFLPWILFLFAGSLDWGFYSWALISTQNAARAAVMYTSANAGTASDSNGACLLAAAQLAYAPNVAGNPLVNSDAGVGNGSTACTASPLVVSAAAVTGPDGQSASAVTVTYTTPKLIPIPGLLTNQITITKTVEMRIRGQAL